MVAEDALFIKEIPDADDTRINPGQLPQQYAHRIGATPRAAVVNQIQEVFFSSFSFCFVLTWNTFLPYIRQLPASRTGGHVGLA